MYGVPFSVYKANKRRAVVLNVSAAAEFVLLAAAAGTGIVASDFGCGAHKRLRHDLSIDEEPVAVNLLKIGFFVMVDFLALQLKLGDELYHSVRVAGTARDGVTNLNAEPMGGARPLFGGFFADVFPGLRVVAGNDEIDITGRVGDIAGLHQFNGSLRTAVALDYRHAALFKFTVRAAGAKRHVKNSFRF